jgi:hypothetical protein
VVTAVRPAVPNLEISCSTQEDIDLGRAADRIAAVRAWSAPPDVVSLNLAEAGATELGAALLERGIGIEAGVFTPDGVEGLLRAPWAKQVHRARPASTTRASRATAAPPRATPARWPTPSLGRGARWTLPGRTAPAGARARRSSRPRRRTDRAAPTRESLERRVGDNGGDWLDRSRHALSVHNRSCPGIDRSWSI